MYLFNSVCQIGQNILVQIRRSNRSEFSYPNPSAELIRIYLSESVGQISQNLLFQISGQNFSEYSYILVQYLSGKLVRFYLSKSVGKFVQNHLCKSVWQISQNLVFKVRRKNRSEYTCPNPSAKSVRIYLSKSVAKIGQNLIV